MRSISAMFSTHIAFKYVERLWQFIETRGSQYTSELCEALAVRQQITVLVACIGHGSEFIHVKNAFPAGILIDFTGTRLFENDG